MRQRHLSPNLIELPRVPLRDEGAQMPANVAYRLPVRIRSPKVAIKAPTNTVSEKPSKISPATNSGEMIVPLIVVLHSSCGTVTGVKHRIRNNVPYPMGVEETEELRDVVMSTFRRPFAPDGLCGPA
jgi:hypothetical protein